jgi:hypothetical protein
MMAALHSDWVIVANVLVGLFLTFGARFFALMLESQNYRQRESGLS